MMLKDEGMKLPERSLQIIAGAGALMEERTTEGRIVLGRCLKDGCYEIAGIVQRSLRD